MKKTWSTINKVLGKGKSNVASGGKIVVKALSMTY